jgi:hypothetical protein
MLESINPCVDHIQKLITCTFFLIACFSTGFFNPWEIFSFNIKCDNIALHPTSFLFIYFILIYFLAISIHHKCGYPTLSMFNLHLVPLYRFGDQLIKPPKKVGKFSMVECESNL